MTLTIDIRPNLHAMALQFGEISTIKSFREPLEKSIRQVMSPSFVRNFEYSGRPVRWRELAPATQKKRGVTAMPLVKSLTLVKVVNQRNIWQINGPKGTAQVTNLARAPYGAVHQTGARYIPERPFLLFQNQDIDDIEEIFEDWYTRRLAAANFRNLR